MKYFIFLAWYIISFTFLPQAYCQSSDLLIIAHRGGVNDGIPENTLQAYQQCIVSDFYAIELDLRATKDKQIVLMHDDRVDRTTNGQGLVSSFSLKELQKLDAGHGNHVPTLVETLGLIKNTKTKLLLDLKLQEQWYRDAIYKIINESDIFDHIIIGARSIEDVAFFRQKNNDLDILGFIPDQKEADIYIGNGANIIRFWADWILEENGSGDLEKLVQRAEVWVTSGNLELSKVQNMNEMGVSGFIHDNPWALKKIQAGF